MAPVLRDLLPEGSPRPRLVVDPDAGDFVVIPGAGRGAPPELADLAAATARHTDVVCRVEMSPGRLTLWLTPRGWREEVQGLLAEVPAPALMGQLPPTWTAVGGRASARTAENPVYLVMWAYARAARSRSAEPTVLQSDRVGREVLAAVLAAYARVTRTPDDAARAASALARAYHRAASRAWQSDPVPGLAPAITQLLGSVLRGSGLVPPRQI